jgi:hypothetical protein
LKSQAATALALVAIAASAQASADAPGLPAAPPPPGPLHRLLTEVRARIDAAIIARPPKLVPPKKLAIQWKLGKVGSLDLGAPLVALTAADLDGDGKAELYAVTPREVIAIGLRGKRLEEVGRVSFGGEPAIPAPRDVVGTAIVDGGAVIASVSSWSKSLRVTWQKKTLAAAAGPSGFALCPGETAQLAPGRNYFADPQNPQQTGRYGARCRGGLVETDGHPLRVRADLSIVNKLWIAVDRCAAVGLGCARAGAFELSNVGTAFEIADVDRDGKPEAIFAGAGAPGDPDTLKVVSLGDDEKKHAKLKKAFTAGGIAGIASADLDGDGDEEVVAAVRLVGASRVDLWRIE